MVAGGAQRGEEAVGGGEEHAVVAVELGSKKIRTLLVSVASGTTTESLRALAAFGLTEDQLWSTPTRNC